MPDPVAGNRAVGPAKFSTHPFFLHRKNIK